jgi:ferrous iron transport protein B
MNLSSQPKENTSERASVLAKPDCCRRRDRHAETSASGVMRDGAHGDACDAGRAAAMRRVVFVGNLNVGKSSMFNALLGARARTMNALGTTSIT